MMSAVACLENRPVIVSDSSDMPASAGDAWLGFLEDGAGGGGEGWSAELLTKRQDGMPVAEQCQKLRAAVVASLQVNQNKNYYYYSFSLLFFIRGLGALELCESQRNFKEKKLMLFEHSNAYRNDNAIEMLILKSCNKTQNVCVFYCCDLQWSCLG
jgi:hypothetical protein